MSARIAFLGLGAMGSRMATRLIEAGFVTTVWNRSAAACGPHVERGARAAESPAAAVVDADIVIAMLRDDEASEAVWCDPQRGALSRLAPGALAIECSTLSPAWVRSLGDRLRVSGHTLIEAPVSGSLHAAEAGQLVFMAGGDAQDVARAHPLLKTLGAAIHHVGPLGAGALSKLATNALLGVQLAAYAEIMSMLRRNEADVPRVLQAIAGTSVWAPVAAYLTGAMLRDDHRPQFPVELIAKDFAYALASAGGQEHAPMMNAATTVFQQAMTQGLGAQNMTAVARLYA
jgi:3-hydroxyisobutyrate dehydrogenase